MPWLRRSTLRLSVPLHEHLCVLVRQLERLPKTFHPFTFILETKIVFLDQLYKSHLDDERRMPATGTMRHQCLFALVL